MRESAVLGCRRAGTPAAVARRRGSGVTETDDRTRHLPAGRKAQVAAYVAEVGQVTVRAIADRFGVSIDTIRRDLDQLGAEGALVRTYGGAVSRQQLPRIDQTVDVRLHEQAREKEQIAQLAAAMVPDSSTIMVNGGTTTLALARALRDHRELTVATNSLLVPPALPASALRDLYVFGGAVRALTQTTVGPVSFRDASGADLDIRCDIAFIAVGAVSAEDGYSTSNLGEAGMMRDMMARADRIAILADSSKFGRRLFARVAEIGGVDCLITDTAPQGALGHALRTAGVEVLTP